MNSTSTARGAHIMGFNDEGRLIGNFNIRTRADWRRSFREARERASRNGTVFLYSASFDVLTGKLISVPATPSAIRAQPAI